jgi:hypothetical protein
VTRVGERREAVQAAAQPRLEPNATITHCYEAITVLVIRKTVELAESAILKSDMHCLQQPSPLEMACSQPLCREHSAHQSES